jgi:hypothetical protein
MGDYPEQPLRRAPRASASGAVSMPLLGLMWLGVVLSGTALMLKYSGSPAKQKSPPARWPEGAQVARMPGQPTLVLFLHPQCPCSIATVGELERIMARCPAGVTLHAVFVRPEGMSQSWVESDLWRKAAAIPGVKVSQDEGGKVARLFQVGTSGEALVYDANGVLAFHGGITVARGHSGDNAGNDAVLALLRQEAAGEFTTPVFGCALRNDDDCQKPGSACKR